MSPEAPLAAAQQSKRYLPARGSCAAPPGLADGCEAKVSVGAGFLRGRYLAVCCLFKNLGLKGILFLGIAFKAYI